MALEPRITIITLGVCDLARSTSFYESLGFTASGDHEGITFFDMKGTQLALFPKKELAKDAKVNEHKGDVHSFTLAHNVSSKKEVDETLAFVHSKGAKIIKPAEDVFWGGYSGYFSDPDGFLWEVAWSPFDQ